MDGARRQTDTGPGPHGDAASGPRDAVRPGPRDDAGRHPLRDAGPPPLRDTGPGPLLYPYIGPPELAAAAPDAPGGVPVATREEFARWAAEQTAADLAQPFTYTVGADGLLRLAPRRSEHVACAGRLPVHGAGEVLFRPDSGGWEVEEISNFSTGYCPEPASFPRVAAALEACALARPAHFTHAAVFRRCEECGTTCVVKDDHYVCAVCDADLPVRWNVDRAVRPEVAPPPPLPAHGIDTARSLEELEGDVWPAPGPPVTALVEAVHALRRRPVGALGTWDMIRLLGQRVGAAVLVPVALDLLRASLPRQAAGGWFEDDLLAAVAAQPPEFWAEHPHWHAETARIADAVAGRPVGPAG
ncbi:contact-dependent growth inhibition system immunity protein [Streptomyces zhihengii]|uniref:contact-dependent growth inhibition system immunity protein n=1 Tax=Streptomyces zhihengii TaxID=1818004 RepID=UPI0036A70DBE